MVVSEKLNDSQEVRPLASSVEWRWAVWAVVAAFGTYFCMYGFRKPFTAATFADASVEGMSFKTLLVSAQVFGYMLSKFIGIKVIAEMPPQRRAGAILLLIAIAELALLLFGLLPRPWNAIALFFNGLPLGMVFGLVLGFLEGRRLTEALTAGLCASFILADGVTKSVGTWLLNLGVTEDWMPCVAGLVFLAPLAVGVVMLAMIPPPTVADVAARSERPALTREDRKHFLSSYAVGLTLLVTMYLLVTVLRSLRADFAPELWKSLGQENEASLYSRSESLVAIGVLIVNGCAVLVRDNRHAFFVALTTCATGFVMVLAALLGQQLGILSGFAFVVFIGLGLYLPYVAMHTTVFERLLAMTRDRGNLGFLMYVADAFGYLGYIAVMLIRNYWSGGGEFLGFFTWCCWGATAVSLACLLLAWRYFAGRCPAIAEPAAVRGVA
jgi:hypothetical protein